MADRDDPPPAQAPAHATIADREIATRPVLGRRRVLDLAVAGTIAALTPLVPDVAEALTYVDRDTTDRGRPRTNVTDNDRGMTADTPGHGRGHGSDSDMGPGSDPAGAGRGMRQLPPGTGRSNSDGDTSPADMPGQSRRPRSGVTDSDQGPGSDPPGNGRNRNQPRLTDADAGPGADPPGGGRGMRAGGNTQSGLTDADYGAGADRPGYGRRGRRGTGISDADYGPRGDPVGQGRGVR